MTHLAARPAPAPCALRPRPPCSCAVIPPPALLMCSIPRAKRLLAGWCPTATPNIHKYPQIPTNTPKYPQIPKNHFLTEHRQAITPKKIVTLVTKIQPAREKIENGRTQYPKNGKVDFSSTGYPNDLKISENNNLFRLKIIQCNSALYYLFFVGFFYIYEIRRQ